MEKHTLNDCLHPRQYIKKSGRVFQRPWIFKELLKNYFNGNTMKTNFYINRLHYYPSIGTSLYPCLTACTYQKCGSLSME